MTTPRSDRGSDLPDGPGTYVLVLRIDEPLEIQAGSLGNIRLAPGDYVYLGSALRGLAPRILRHLRRYKTRHWHIDSITEKLLPAEVWWRESDNRAECTWAHEALALQGAEAPAPGFGSSDCVCETHLVRLPGESGATELLHALDRLSGPLTTMKTRSG